MRRLRNVSSLGRNVSSLGRNVSSLGVTPLVTIPETRCP
jgi:hypothetical protein